MTAENSTKTIEIEFRYEILDSAQLPKFLASAEYIGQKHDIDVYLDTPDIQLYQRGIFIRVRNNRTLDIKFNRACLDNPNLAIQDYCEEHSFSLPLHSNDREKLNTILASLNLNSVKDAHLDELKAANKFGTHYVIDKIRKSYTHDKFTVCIDEIANLGLFLEIEHMAHNVDDLVLVRDEVQNLLKNLSLKPLRTGYGTLLLKKNNFAHYLQGRFVLEEDRV